MNVLISEIIECIEKFAPVQLQENYDNAGLVVGAPNKILTGVLLCVDSTEEIIDEAINKNCNLVIAHHPIIFNGIKKLNGKNYIERTIIKAIKNDISIYVAHTNLDNLADGVNKKIADKLGLNNINILRPKLNQLRKLVTFCPAEHAEKLREKIFEAGAGHIGNYDSCSFNVNGEGTFRGNEKTKPFVGKKEELNKENEIRIETIFPFTKQKTVLNALISNHPYEEVAYDVYPLDNEYAKIGSGAIGDLDVPMSEVEFLGFLKKAMNTPIIRHTKFLHKPIHKISICGGSGSFLLQDAISKGADVFITADFKYHDFFDADNKIIIADIGHYESEQFTVEIFEELIENNFSDIPVFIAQTETNPVLYF
ncbi:MAG: Nif3-like dinuclear metal center hexameric protein [Bacteroidota bacterium]